MKNVEIIMDAHCYVFNREDGTGGWVRTWSYG